MFKASMTYTMSLYIFYYLDGNVYFLCIEFVEPCNNYIAICGLYHRNLHRRTDNVNEIQENLIETVYHKYKYYI